MRKQNRKKPNIFIRIRNAIVGHLEIIFTIAAILFFIGISIYNFQYNFTSFSLVAFILSIFIIIRSIIRDKIEEPYFISIIFAGVFILFIWQLILFIFLICAKYVIPLCSKGLFITYTYIIHLAQLLNISDPSGLIGAFIGGVFSVIAVKITITAAYKKNWEDNIDSASPRIVMTTVPESIDRIVGKGYMSSHNDETFSPHCYTHYIPVYLLNLGGDAINIKLHSFYIPSYYTYWKIRSSSLDISSLLDVEIEDKSQNTIDFSIDEFPILKKGEALEVRLANSLKDRGYNIKFDIDYLDIFSNRYSQFHTTRNIGILDNITLPDGIRRSRKASSIWRRTGINTFLKKDNMVREVIIRSTSENSSRM